MAKTLIQEGVNYFIYVEVSAAWVMVGCANTISEDLSSAAITVNCDSAGTDPLTFYGTRTKKITIGGVYFGYTSPDAAANYGVADFKAAQAAKTKLNIRIGASATIAATIVEDYTGCMIESISVASKNGDQSTYNISLMADSVTTTTIPA